MFDDLNLDHANTAKRVKLLLDALDAAAPTAVFFRTDLDALCGQPNKPLGRALRKIFIRKPEVVSFKNGEMLEYVVFKPNLDALKAKFAEVPGSHYLRVDFENTPIATLRRLSKEMRAKNVNSDIQYQFNHRLSNRLFEEQKSQKFKSIFD